MPDLMVACKINSLDEVVRASRIGKKKKFHTLIRTDMNEITNEKSKMPTHYYICAFWILVCLAQIDSLPTELNATENSR